MLYYKISVKNVNPSFSPNQETLCDLAKMVKHILPGQNPEIHFEYSRAKEFIVKPDLKKSYPIEATLVDIYPQGGMINNKMVAENIEELASAIATLTVLFLCISDESMETDSKIRTTITACPGISFKFLDHDKVESFK